jgi:hypothetical protein
MFLMFLLLIVLLYLFNNVFTKLINKNEAFSQNYYPHLYNSNEIPCNKLSRIK